MSHLPERRTSALSAVNYPRSTARIQRAVQHDVAVEQGRAIVAAARTQAVEYVGHSALRAVEGLTEMEAQALQRTPLGDARYKAIVDTATSALARIVAETGRD
ncbi:hypothetical protein [Actinokineospora spheciospongiae]|uniref:hypothetical protein n=1 Tax=Actinokineospora spheciospongiae TaxID=909613 RepID=UPI000D8E8B5C|nr:hypothetical protein [Actinokineospora spheciospongiae]PWW53673.1 hypothetical protein DFQ13_11556 [Actinokineospora spheciospongiae]